MNKSKAVLKKGHSAPLFPGPTENRQLCRWRVCGWLSPGTAGHIFAWCWKGRKGVSSGQIHWIIPYLILWWYHEAFCQSSEVQFDRKSLSWKNPSRVWITSRDFTWLTERGWWNCVLSRDIPLPCPSLTDWGISRHQIGCFTRLTYVHLRPLTYVRTDLLNSDCLLRLKLAWPSPHA